MYVSVFAVLAMLVVSVALVFEVRAWSKGTRMITQRQKVYRIMAAVMMNAVLLAVILGPTIHERAEPMVEVSYWGVTMMIAFLLLFVAMLDIRAGLANYRQSRREAFHTSFSKESQEE